MLHVCWCCSDIAYCTLLAHRGFVSWILALHVVPDVPPRIIFANVPICCQPCVCRCSMAQHLLPREVLVPAVPWQRRWIRLEMLCIAPLSRMMARSESCPREKLSTPRCLFGDGGWGGARAVEAQCEQYFMMRAEGGRQFNSTVLGPHCLSDHSGYAPGCYDYNTRMRHHNI